MTLVTVFLAVVAAAFTQIGRSPNSETLGSGLTVGLVGALTSGNDGEKFRWN